MASLRSLFHKGGLQWGIGQSLNTSRISLLPRLTTNLQRTFAVQQTQKTEYASAEDLSLLRNIGISAHIDSGKTTTTERILFYTGRIKEIHEVRGKDGVGAKMDSMELEREKGITIKSAATHTEWGDHHINIIDTPGHVDFTIEVERSLQILDGAIMIVCASSGVQSQTITVDRQMKRYNVPRICFMNKCDRTGANPYKIVDDIRRDLDLNAALIQIPIGLEDEHLGCIDIIDNKAIYFEGPNGETVKKIDKIPDGYEEKIQKYKMKLLEALGEHDEEMEMHYLEETMPSAKELKDCIRKLVIDRKFVPIYVGSAYKNKGVQTLLDGVIDYLPSPLDTKHYAFDPTKSEDDPNYKVPLTTNKKDPLLFLAFKLEESQFGQLTWCRVYQGLLKKGITIQPNNSIDDISASSGATVIPRAKKTRLSRIVRLHSNEIQDISYAQAGDICAMFGVDTASGITFSDGKVPYVISDLHIPETVVSLAVKPKDKLTMNQFSKAIERFQREDPTFKVRMDDHTGQCIFSGMGELHLQIYIERIQREYGVQCDIGRPRVNFKEGITNRVQFDYQHKKQTGGAGQYARIMGYMEPIEGVPNPSKNYEFINNVRGGGIPSNYIKSVEIGFEEMIEKGPLVGGPIEGLRVCLEDGVTHEVDSSDFAFRQAAKGAFRQYLNELGPKVSEPVMSIEIIIPSEFQNDVVSDISSKGFIIHNLNNDSPRTTVIKCFGQLDNMFGYATQLRSLTQGKGEFSMEYAQHEYVTDEKQERLQDEYQQQLAQEAKEK